MPRLGDFRRQRPHLSLDLPKSPMRQPRQLLRPVIHSVVLQRQLVHLRRHSEIRPRFGQNFPPHEIVVGRHLLPQTRKRLLIARNLVLLQQQSDAVHERRRVLQLVFHLRAPRPPPPRLFCRLPKSLLRQPGDRRVSLLQARVFSNSGQRRRPPLRRGLIVQQRLHARKYHARHVVEIQLVFLLSLGGANAPIHRPQKDLKILPHPRVFFRLQPPLQLLLRLSPIAPLQSPPVRA